MSGIVKPLFGAQLNLAHPLSAGLVGCWLMNENSGNKVHDSSGQNNTGTLTGFNDPPIATSGWNAGPHGGALAFAGGNSVISSFPSIISPVGSSRTITAWVRISDAVRRGICGTRGPVGGGFAFSVNRTVGSLCYFHTGSTTFNVSAGLVSGQLYHLCAALDAVAGTILLYVNGKLLASTGCGNEIANGGYTGVIGCEDSTFTPTFNGLQSSLSIYSLALSAEDIAWHYAEPFCMFADGWGLYESWLKQRVATGLLSAAFTGKSPGAAFTGKSPGATFSGKSPGVTWSN